MLWFKDKAFKKILDDWPIGTCARLCINGERVMIIGYTEAWSIEVRRRNLQTLLVRAEELEEVDGA